jgi:hypothetical protein
MSNPVVTVTTSTKWRDTQHLSTPELWEELEVLRAREVHLRDVLHARILQNKAHRKPLPSSVVSLEQSIDPDKYFETRRAASQAELERRQNTNENIAPYVSSPASVPIDETTPEPQRSPLSGNWQGRQRNVRAR